MKCPICNENLVQIIYGMPTPEAFEKAEKKEIYLGGCEVFVGLEQPIHHCYNCNNNFYKDLVNYEKVNDSTQVNIELPSFINKKDSSEK